ncbi:hypothetical protein [Thermococcus sp.]
MIRNARCALQKSHRSAQEKYKKKRLETAYAWEGIEEIFQKKGRAHAREFAGLIKKILPTANPVEIQEKYAGEGFGYDKHYGYEDLPLHEIVRLNILGQGCLNNTSIQVWDTYRRCRGAC